MKIFFKLSTVTVVFLSTTCLGGQSGRITGVADVDVSRPLSELPAGSKDPAAANQLLEYLKAVGSSNWIGFEARGFMVYGAGTDGVAYPATLTISKLGQTRLDVERQEGTTSLRISGSIARLKQTNGRVIPLPLRNAAAGLIAYPALLAPSFEAGDFRVADGGTVEVDGKTLHKISLQQRIGDKRQTTTIDRTYVVSDLYFSQDNLLYKSATSVESLAQTRYPYLEIATYTDYRLVDGVKIPFHIATTLDGQPSWAFTMADVNSNPAGSVFTF